METMMVNNPTKGQMSIYTVVKPTQENTHTQIKTEENLKDTDIQSQQSEKAKLNETTKEFNKMSDELNLDVRFAYNDKIDQFYLNVIDKSTGKIIRKLPSEEAMKISESMKDLVGTLFDKKG